MIHIYNNQPIIVGLAGKAGSGKTSVAEYMVPKGSLETMKNGYKWDHLFFALPLYEMLSIKKNIKGFNEESRKLFALHETLYDLYGKSAIGQMPEYGCFVELVHNIYNFPIDSNGVKPRSFLQKVGDLCRAHYPDCFVHWVIHKAVKMYRQYANSIDLISAHDDNFDQEAKMIILVSDVRYPNEAEAIKKHPNGFIICFDASEQTLRERLIKRDGRSMSIDEASHPSENGIETIKGISDIIINTDNMTVEEQVEATLGALSLEVLSA